MPLSISVAFNLTNISRYYLSFLQFLMFCVVLFLTSISLHQIVVLLQDLLSTTNIAKQHEVWDFLSVSSKVWICLVFLIVRLTSDYYIVSSVLKEGKNDNLLTFFFPVFHLKNYSFGKSSTMRTLADIWFKHFGFCHTLFKCLGYSYSKHGYPRVRILYYGPSCRAFGLKAWIMQGSTYSTTQL